MMLSILWGFFWLNYHLRGKMQTRDFFPEWNQTAHIYKEILYEFKSNCNMFSKHFFKNIQLTSFTIRNNYRMSEEIRLKR